MRTLSLAILTASLICAFGFADNRLRAESNGGGIVSFSAEVADDTAEICSAPGTENYYSTGTLHRNDTVEIFFKTADGWCAIRPPEGSYSWVNGNFVQIQNDSSGQIVSPSPDKEVPARVGADSVLKSTAVQVGLKNGRTVRVLGETTLTGGKKWYKIAPPSGEFRWIHQNHLRPNEDFARIPEKLTRESEFFTASNASASNVEPNGPVEELPREILRETPAQNDTAQNDTADFNLELARLNRDLFTAIERSGSPEVFDLLADRAASLFCVADNDEQRSRAQQIYQKIKTCKNGATPPSSAVPYSNGPSVADTTGAGSERIAFSVPTQNTPSKETKNNKNGLKFAFAGGNSPFAGFSRNNGKPSKIVPPANYHSAALPTMSAMRTAAPIVAPSTLPAQPTAAQPAKLPISENPAAPTHQPPTGSLPGPDQPNAQPPASDPFLAQADKDYDAARLAEADKDYDAARLAEADKDYDAARLAEADKDYDTTRLAQADKDYDTARLAEADKDYDATRLAKADKDYDATRLAEAGSSNNAIRPVAAFVPANTNESTAVPNEETSQHAAVEQWVAPSGFSSQRSVPRTAMRFEPSNVPSRLPVNDRLFDASGVLGYFPDRPEGYPPYALVRENNSQLAILCYVVPEKGKNLDAFVGKNIGVSGRLGWFKRGAENRKLLTANAIFLLDQ